MLDRLLTLDSYSVKADRQTAHVHLRIGQIGWSLCKRAAVGERAPSGL